MPATMPQGADRNAPQHIIVASQNPVKLDATREGFRRMFPAYNFTFEGIAVDSGVSDQPMSRDETLRGASNRAQAAAQQYPDAAYTVGIEGGVQPVDSLLEVFAWVVVHSHGQIGRAQTGIFYLPQEVARLIVDEGLELGAADDRIFGRNNSKQKTGSIGLLTGDALDRTGYYINAVMMALIPFKQPHFTWNL